MSTSTAGATLLSLFKTFAIPLTLWSLRNGLAYYRDVKASYNRQKPSIRPLPVEVSRALNILFAFAVYAFISMVKTPPNIFALTNGRMQTTTDVLFNRLAALRPLTSQDEALRSKLTTRDGRLLYLQYGPEVLAGCTYCKTDDPNSFLIYALPMLLAPHLLHLAAVGLATSSRYAGATVGRWRTPAVVAGVALAALDLYTVAAYDTAAINTRAMQTKDFDFFFWRMRALRGGALVLASAALAGVLWASGTNRLLVQAFGAPDRVATAAQQLERANFNLWAAGSVRNATVRDPALRGRSARYWNEELQVYEEREVVDALRGALSRIDVTQLTQAANGKADEIVGALG